MKDQLVKALACEKRVRIYICNTTEMINEAQKAHDLWPTASATLGRVLSVGSMMGANLKSEKEKLSITINGGGPIGTIIVDAYVGGNVRGFVSDPHVHYQYNDTNKLAVGVAVGKEGYLEVKKDMGLKEEFGGKVALQSGEIGEDFAYYFAMSEQTPSLVSLGVLVDTDNTIISSGGLLIQMLPGAREEDIVKTEEAIARMDSMSNLIRDNHSLVDILNMLYDDIEVLETTDIAFTCNCSRERVEDAIRLISKEDIQEMIKEDQGCIVNCQFCAKEYKFDEDDLKGIQKSKG